ncbi:MAG TPA: hypothetical protein VHA82_18940 [Ramlibacter sp.]|uniref:hypothetical protein n=1 Tax=Ramlibacter sp. TaxID=1917967 RepID=UPI002BF14505|nr:hypothetical protein [Ramlibacter sp.]HVZ45891.1 hypothetical protein [Ramlibacter sp.]
MPRIEIDDEVFAFLQARARPFVDTPNSALRNLLGIGQAVASPAPTESDPELDALLAQAVAQPRSSKAPKVDLMQLVSKGSLREGQKVHLIDYRGNRVRKLSAAVSSGALLFEGKRYSMSSLATELLRREGYRSGAVRGPTHWVIDDGRTVKELWDAKGLSKTRK